MMKQIKGQSIPRALSLFDWFPIFLLARESWWTSHSISSRLSKKKTAVFLDIGHGEGAPRKGWKNRQG